MFYLDLSPLPNTKSTAISYFPRHCSPSPLILQSLHGYNAYAHVRRIQIHHSRTLLTLVSWLEWAMLQKETGKTLGNWILHDFIHCWGLLCEIITNNGLAFLKALAYLEKHYYIKHIWISGYNSQANGLIEWLHFDVQQAIFKAWNGDKSRWSLVAFSVFWAERVMIKCRMGCSPYFAATGTHPLLPINIAEANYLLPPSDSTLSTTDLIARQAIILQKQHNQLSKLKSQVYATRVQVAIIFEWQHKDTTNDYDFKLGDLVLIRNTAIEKALNCRMWLHYLGPLIVISRNKGGAHIMSELGWLCLWPTYSCILSHSLLFLHQNWPPFPWQANQHLSAMTWRTQELRGIWSKRWQ